MRFGLIGGSYTASSTAIADEETINWYQETRESSNAGVSPERGYGGSGANSQPSLLRTPGIAVAYDFGADAPVRGSWELNGRAFVVAGPTLYEIFADGTSTNRGAVQNDGLPASIAASTIQLSIVSFGHLYCYDLTANTLTDVTSALVGVPVVVKYGDGFFIALLQGNKFQVSAPLDGTTWPGLQVNEVSVFPENVSSISVNHRELWVHGLRHTQPYQNTGSDNVYDVNPGTLIEKGCAATFSTCLLDNSVFWIDEDERGARSAWRSNGYTPQRISTHAVETDLDTYTEQQIAGLTSYAYQEAGHLFWVLYIPGSSWSWVYDVGEQLWHKRAKWVDRVYSAHWGWNHVYAFGKHLIGDWESGKLYDLDRAYLDDNGTPLRRLRRTPVVLNELERIFHKELKLFYTTGTGPQPPLTDGDGNPREPQTMTRWSNNSGATWSSEHWKPLGAAGQYGRLVRYTRLGSSRQRIYENVFSDPVDVALIDGYLEIV